MRALRRAVPWLLALLAMRAGAHEFWLLPARFQLAPGEVASLSLAVGQDFAGEPVPFSRPLVADLRQLTGAGTIDLRPLAAFSGSAAALKVRLARPGTQVLALDTHPSFIVLPADKFNDYLRLEGLQDVLQARERAGTSGMPGRERYRRNVKTIVQVGPTVDDTPLRRTGQRLEIVPVTAAGWQAAQPLTLQVWFDQRPLPGALLKLWNGAGAGLLALQAVTDPQGRVTVTPPRDGTWMASVVHMIPAPVGGDVDWDSYWGNLTFALPAAAAALQGSDGSSPPRR